MKAITLLVFGIWTNKERTIHWMINDHCRSFAHCNNKVTVFAAVSCRPDKPDLKQLKAEGARKKACMHDCASVKLDPICAGKQGEKPKSFGNECVMNNYNCEHKETLQKISKGECPGSDGIRLS